MTWTSTADDLVEVLEPERLPLSGYVQRILRGEHESLGLPPATRSAEDTVKLFLRLWGKRSSRPWTHPATVAREDQFHVVASPFPDRCGGSTARALHVPWHRNPGDCRVAVAHEWAHGMTQRDGPHDLTEPDFWRLVAVWAVRASRYKAGLFLFPTWLVGGVPSEISYSL